MLQSLSKFKIISILAKLCDVILVIGDTKIGAHRVVLGSASDYFAAMFTSNIREATVREVTMKDIDPESLKSLIKYMYLGTYSVLNADDEFSTKPLLKKVFSVRNFIKFNRFHFKNIFF